MVLKWPGGKSKIVGWIKENTPCHNTFVDVFGGSGIVTYNMNNDKVRYVYNDLNDKLYNFFQVLKNKSSDLSHLISCTPYSRKEFDNAIDIINSDSFNDLDDVNKAAVFLVANRQSFGGKMQKPWSITLNGEINYQTWNKIPDVVEKVALRFKNVFLENSDYRVIIQKWDGEDTLFYLDPPYEGVETLYYEMNKKVGFNHWEMYECLSKIVGSYMVSYYGGDSSEHDSELIQAYAQLGCEIHRKTVAKHLSASETKETAVEVLIIKKNNWSLARSSKQSTEYD